MTRRIFSLAKARRARRAPAAAGRFCVALCAAALAAACAAPRFGEGPPSPEARRIGDATFNVLAGYWTARADPAAAVDYFEAAAARVPTPSLLAGLAVLATAAGRYDTGVAAIERLLELDPDNLPARRSLALLYARAGRDARAIAEIERIFAANEAVTANLSANAGIIFLDAGALLSGRADDAALQTMRALAERFPARPEAHIAHAALAMQMERYPEAAAAAERARAAGADPARAAALKAHALIRAGRAAEGLEVVRAQLRATPGALKLRYFFARSLAAAGETREARDEFLRLAAHFPNNSAIDRALGSLHFDLDDLDAAERHFARWHAATRRDDEHTYYLGRIAERREDAAAAIAQYARVGPRAAGFFVDARIGLARALAGLSRFDEALEALAEGFSLTADAHARLRLGLARGETLALAGRYAEALAFYSDGLAAAPDNAELRYARALLADRMGRFDIAEADLKRIIERDPDNAQALNALGYMLADRNLRLAEARGYIERAYARRPDDAAILDSMGWVAYRLNETALAERFLRQALAAEFNDEILAHLIEVLRALGKDAEADDLLRQGFERFPDSDFLRRLRDAPAL